VMREQLDATMTPGSGRLESAPGARARQQITAGIARVARADYGRNHRHAFMGDDAVASASA